MPSRTTRTDFATLNPELLRIFDEFAEHGALELTFPTRKLAIAIRTQIYNTRLMMQEVVLTDDLAARLFPAAQQIYIETETVDASLPQGPTTLRLKLHPLTALRHPDNPTPWKDQL